MIFEIYTHTSKKRLHFDSEKVASELIKCRSMQQVKQTNII